MSEDVPFARPRRDSDDAASLEPRGPAASPRRGANATSSRQGPDQVHIRLPSGEHAWVSADAFNLISEKEFRDSERLRRLKGQRNLAAAVAAFALIGAGAVFVSLMARPDRPDGVTAAATTGEPSPAGDGAVERRPSPAEPAPEVREIELAVEAWAQAWSAQDVAAVSDFYSPSFLVPDGMGRATWEELRRERIANPELLAVTVEGLVAERTGPASAVARFQQIYDTPGYRAWVTKTLELAYESGRWLIIEEVASLAEIGTGSLDTGEPEATPPAVTNP